MNLVMPDVELLVVDALRHYLGHDRVWVSPPEDWADQMPMVAVGWRGGAPNSRPERLQVNDLELKAFGRSRKEATDLYRSMDMYMRQACLDHYTNKGKADPPGVMCHVTVISPHGIEFEGLTAKHPDSALIEGVFRVTSAPLI